MVLITQPNSLPASGLNLYSLIILLARAEESIPVETVKNLFECGAEISVSVLTKQADDMELAFSIGSLVGENGGTDNVTISLESVSAKDMLKRMGMEKALYTAQKRSVSRKKTGSARATKTEQKAEASPIPEKAPSAIKQIKGETSGSRKTGSVKLPAAFSKILKECSISKEYAASVAKAVQDSAESISYELRLQLNIMNRDESADVYAKTKDRYDEMKALF